MARHQNFVFFIPFSAPGDRIRARVTRLKKNYGEAHILEVLEQGSSRREALCSVYGQCGGCQFQHINYEEQLTQKNAYIQKALKAIYVEDLKPILPSSTEFYYRNRIQVHVNGDDIGYMKKKSDEMVSIRGCPIAEGPIHEALGNEAFRERVIKAESKKVEVYLAEDESLQLRTSQELTRLMPFSQVNRFQNKELVEVVLSFAKELSGLLKPNEVLDLYAGAGNLSFPLHECLGLPLTGVELSAHAVEMARLKVNKGARISFESMDVKAYVESKSNRLDRTLVVTDPPRQGLEKSICEALISKGLSSIIHVGCDLMSFARDLKSLQDAGYKVLRVQPIDMFPQTDHVELVAQIHQEA